MGHVRFANLELVSSNIRYILKTTALNVGPSINKINGFVFLRYTVSLKN